MKTICSKSDLHRKYLSGAQQLCDCVSATLGPKGQTVLLKKKDRKPYITKDGVTVASFFEVEDPIENAAVAIIRQAADETAINAGDGTTTAILLATAIYKESLKYLTMQIPAITIKEQIEDSVLKLVEDIKSRSVPLKTFEDVINVTTISANNDKVLGKLIGNAIDKIGKDGSVVVEEAKSLDTTIEFVEGFRIDSGLISKSFVTDERTLTLTYEKPLILITDENLDSVDSLMPVLSLVSRDGRPLIIVANEVSGSALASLVMNIVRGTMKVAAIKPPRYGEERNNILEDLAVATGGTVISKLNALNLSDIKLEHFGTCSSVESSLRSTTFVGCQGDSEKIAKQVETIKEIIKDTPDIEEAERQQERITRLSSAVAIIRVGGFTESEVIEKKHRIEDALEAVKAAQDNGIVIGGGVSYVIASRVLNLDNYGDKILMEALKYPIFKLAENAGVSGELICEKVKLQDDLQFGYNFRTNSYENLKDSGIIEPAKVQIEVLKNASSAAISLIFSNHAVIES